MQAIGRLLMWLRTPLFLVSSFVLSLSIFPLFAQQPTTRPEVDSIIPKPLSDTIDRVRIRNGPKDSAATPKNAEQDNNCLLPPLNLVHSPTVAISNLQVSAKAKKEYDAACAALKDKKTEDAEKRLRKAVKEDPRYSAAWVTMGQVLAAQQQTEAAHNACTEASTADSTYVPAYLCLADIAARAQAWDEVLKQTNRALELEPSTNAVAYEYNAAANLNLHKLADAEKSALRALDIDKNHAEPRVYFVLAQIYEAKGDPTNEAAQLREYLKFATNAEDTAMVKQYLTELDKQAGK